MQERKYKVRDNVIIDERWKQMLALHISFKLFSSLSSNDLVSVMDLIDPTFLQEQT